MSLHSEVKQTEIDEEKIQLIYRNNSILENIRIPELKYSIPKIKTITLSPFETLYIYEDSSLPIVNIQIIIEGGLLHEPTDQVGILSATIALWESGGANHKKSEKISEELSEVGAEVQFSIQNDFIIIRFFSLKENFDKAFKILKEILLLPDFDEDKLNIIKMQMIDAINRRNDKPETIASRKLKEIMFYPKKILESIQKDEVEKITRNQIIQTYKEILSHRKMHIGIDGDISDIPIENIFREISQKMGEVKKPFEIKKFSPDIQGLSNLQNKIVLVDKNVPQSIIFIGTYIPTRDTKDFYPLQVGNYILGGGSFVSRFMREVRVKRGLAYYSYSQNFYDAHYGRFIVNSGTTSEKVDETQRIILDIIQRFPETLTDEEIQIAKDSIINSFIFEFDNPTSLIYLKIILNIQGIPENYLERFPEKIQKVTKEDIIRVFKKYIKPERFWNVIVGPKSLEDKLKKINKNIIILEPESQIQ